MKFRSVRSFLKSGVSVPAQSYWKYIIIPSLIFDFLCSEIGLSSEVREAALKRYAHTSGSVLVAWSREIKRDKVDSLHLRIALSL